MKCEHCGIEFEPKRSDARYCCTGCRIKHNRLSVSNSDLSVSKEPVSDTDNDLSVTDDDGCVTDNVTDNPCQYLGANIHKDRDHHQSITYDTSEEGFKRRNKAWDTMSDKFKAEIRAGAIRRKAERIEHIAVVKARREAIKYQSI